MQGFILQGSFVDTGLKGFFFAICKAFPCNGKGFLAIWCRLLLARKGGSAVRGGSESGGMKGGGYELSLWQFPKFHSDFFVQRDHSWMPICHSSFLGPKLGDSDG